MQIKKKNKNVQASLLNTFIQTFRFKLNRKSYLGKLRFDDVLNNHHQFNGRSY